MVPVVDRMWKALKKLQLDRTVKRSEIAYAYGFVKGFEEGSPSSADTKKREVFEDLPKPGVFYLSTAINYANGKPHMGHAYEAITSDVICRWKRRFGEDVFFLTGSDEHGQKVANYAAKHKMTPKASCDVYVKGFQDLNEKLAISNDAYIRTTDPKHYEHVQKMWLKSVAKGDIYLSEYKGWYSTRDERFVTDKEAEEKNYFDGDPKDGVKLVEMSEPAYKFRMGKYQKTLLKHIEDHPDFIQPDKARNTILNRLRNDELRDLSVSRTKISWGIPVPGDKDHVMYVWFDALNNYLSGIDYLKDKSALARYWPANVHVIGKDIVWFHCVIWPCILFSCGVPLPRAVFAHGFVNDKDGKKMSKTAGNVVDPLHIIDQFSSDQMRYYLVRDSNFGDEVPFDPVMMKGLCDADLANKLGNLVNRACRLCKMWCESKVPSGGEVVFDVAKVRKLSWDALEKFDLKRISELAITCVRETNDFLTNAEPWKKDKTQAFRAKCVADTLESVYVAAHFLGPLVPDCEKKMFEAIGNKPKSIRELRQMGNLTVGSTVVKAVILFPRENMVGKANRGKGLWKDKKQGKKRSNGQKGGKSKKGGGGGFTQKQLNKMKPIEKLTFRVGRIVKAWPMEGSTKCYCEEIDLGEESPRQIASGLRNYYDVDDLVGRMVVVASNLKPKKIASFMSHGMVLCGWNKEHTKCEFVDPPAGSKIGERVTVKGITFPQDVMPMLGSNASRKMWDAVKPKLTSDATGVAMFDGSPLMTSGGVCKCSSISDGILE